MYRVDIAADLNDEDDTGYVWTFLDEARDPPRSSLAPSSWPETKTRRPYAKSSISPRRATALSSTSGSCPAWSKITGPWWSGRSPASPALRSGDRRGARDAEAFMRVMWKRTVRG